MFYSKFQKKLQRTCGTCDMCCRGYLKLVLDNELFENGKNCKFLKELGCSIYLNRPTFCKEFNCLYIIDNSIPEWLKPEFSKVIMLWRKIDNLVVMEVAECGETVQQNVLDWLIDIFLSNKVSNIILSYESTFYHMTCSQQDFDIVQNNSKLNQKVVLSAKNLHFLKEKIPNLV